MALPRELINHFEQRIDDYGRWRARLHDSASRLRGWLTEQNVVDAQTERRLGQVIDSIRDDHLYVAFVAEFSRGKSELINAAFFSDLGKRVLPSTAGRTTMCPTELRYDDGVRPSIRLLPIESRETEHTVAYFKTRAEEWTDIELPLGDPQGVATALGKVTEVRRVTRKRAEELGFLIARGPEDADGLQVAEDGTVEIPNWRHAVINYPHPLLEQGLVVLDTPGLNALGAEPELTLGMLTTAHSVVFVLAADTGVTKTDLQVWRNHVCGKAETSPENKLVILNKVDVLWDELRDPREVASQIRNQIEQTSATLDVPEENIFALSAQKALLGRTRADTKLVHSSGITSFEDALGNMLIPAKQRIVRERIREELSDVIESSRSVMRRRTSDSSAHLAEVKALNQRNVEVVRSMLRKLKGEREQLERNMQRFQANRQIFSQHTVKLYDLLNPMRLERLIAKGKRDMALSLTTMGLRQHMNYFLEEVTRNMEDISREVREVEGLMDQVYRYFQDEHGVVNIKPRKFSTARFQREIHLLGERHEYFLRGLSMLMTEQTVLVRRYYESVMTRVRDTYERANREIDTWLRSVMSPLETEIREHQGQLRRRLDSMRRINQTGDSLDERMAELRHMREGLVKQQEELETLVSELVTVLDEGSDSRAPALSDHNA